MGDFVSYHDYDHCPKCGEAVSGNIIHYCQPSTYVVVGDDGKNYNVYYPQGFLSVKCRRCGFAWQKKTLDHKEGV